MNKSLIAFICIVALFLGINVYAQDIEMTPYEQKREQLGVQAMEKIMNTMSAYDKALFSVNLMNALKEAHEEEDRFQEMAISENILFAFCDLGEGLQTEANLLTRSFDMSDVYTGEMLQEWKEIGRWYKQERLKLDQTRTDEDIKREHDRAVLMGEQPGIAGVKQRVRKEFLKWAKKGEFEKTVAYNERMSKRGTAVFDSLCFVQFNEMINTEMNRSVDRNYDADREGYGTKFYYGEKGNEAAYVDAFWPITPQQLRIVEKVDWESTYSKGLFEKDGYFFPATYHFEMYSSGWSTSNQKWDIVLGEPRPIVLAIREVIGDNVLCDINHIFDYSQYSLNLITQDEFVWKVWNYFNEQDSPYLKKNDSGIGNFPFMQGPQYKELFPEGKEFFTKEEVESVFNKIAAEKVAKEKEKENNERIKKFLEDTQFEVFNDEAEVLSFLDNYSEQQRGEYLAIKFSGFSNGILRTTTSSEFLNDRALQIILGLVKRIDLYSDTYMIDMKPLYQYIIETAPYFAKKYKKGTLEERISKFKKDVMSKVVTLEY